MREVAVTELIVIGGTGATKEAYPLYAPLLNSVPSDIPARERYFPLPYKGLGRVEDTYRELEEQVFDFTRTRCASRPVVVGHSQGGVHAAMLGQDRLASAVVTLAAPHGGVPSLKALEELSPAAADLDSRSLFIASHTIDLATWPESVPFHTVNATVDQLVPRQFGITTSTRWWDAPKWVPRCCLRIPQGVKRLRNMVPSDHILLPYSSGVRWLVNSLVGESDEMRLAS
jgi:pimeloyl-ACP methyl ester carboxylesterase